MLCRGEAKVKVEDVLGLKVKYNYEVSGISIDSRKTKKNDIFVCIDGENVSGNDFIDELIKKKVRTFVTNNIDIYKKYVNEKLNIVLSHDVKKDLGFYCKKFYENISQKVHLVGVTGTNGKTTVTTLLYKYYRYLGKSCTLIGTNGIYINDLYFETANTTPDIITIYEIMKKSIDNGSYLIIMEVSSQGIKEGRVNGLSFDVGLLTNITLDHLDYHKTFDDYFYTKVLFLSRCNNVIVNRDSNKFLEVNRAIDKKITTFGKSEADYHINNIDYDIERTSFDLDIYGQNFHIQTSMLGEYNIYNVTSFIALVDYLGSFNQYTLSYLSKKITIPGRFEIIETNRGKFVIDFAHTPDGVENVLKLLNTLKAGKLITVIGMGGNRDKSKRKIVGKILSENSDIIILTEDNSRFEETMDIINEIQEGITENKEKVLIVLNRIEAIKKAYSISSKKDIVAVLGKGNENYIIKGDIKLPYSDKEEVYKLGK